MRLEDFKIKNFNKIGYVANSLVVLTQRYERYCGEGGILLDEREKEIVVEATGFLYKAQRGLQNIIEPSSVDVNAEDCRTFNTYIDFMSKHALKDVKNDKDLIEILRKDIETHIQSLEKIKDGWTIEHIGLDNLKRTRELFRRIGEYAVRQNFSGN